MTKTLWMVMAVKESIEIEAPILNMKQDVPLVCADGMVGMAPVFKTKRDAVRYAGKKFTVMQVEVTG